MGLFAISDLHLSRDPRITKPMDVFGPAWADHDRRLEEHWRRLVSPEDTVMVAGDISWALKLEEAMEDLAFIHELPGRKILLKGNHDLWWHGITQLNRLFSSITFLQNSAIRAEGRILAGSRGWICPGEDYFDQDDERIYRRELLRLESSLKEAKKLQEEDLAEGREPSKIIGMLHYPPTDSQLEPSGFMELFSAYGVEEVVYGHLHGKERFEKGFQGERDGVRYRLVSLDYVDAMPQKIGD